MSRSPSNITTTTRDQPPGFLQGPLTTATSAAESQFTGGAAGGSNISGGSGTGSSAGALNFGAGGVGSGGAAGPGSGLIGQGQGLIGQTLSGQFLDPNTNPFLQSTFNRAADLTQGRLDTEFAGAGRNLGAARPARSEELQTLSSNIFGQNFQRERDRQTAALTSAQDFDPLNILINQLAGIIPGAGGVTTSTQPVFRTGLF